MGIAHNTTDLLNHKKQQTHNERTETQRPNYAQCTILLTQYRQLPEHEAGYKQTVYVSFHMVAQLNKK